MKPNNFPAKKLKRKLKAQGKDVNSPASKLLLDEARRVRTKKYRGPKK